MFKTLEQKWNARTPVWLHNGTKENIIFQLTLTMVIVGSYSLRDWYTARRDYPELYKKSK